MSANAESITTSRRGASQFMTAAEQVRQALIQQGLETPMINTDLTRDQKHDRIVNSMTAVLTTLGLDLSDDSLRETPHRIARMYLDEIFSGLDYTNFPKITVIDNKMQVDEMVKVSNINVISTCEHHLITIDGKSKVAYIPKDKIIGLSKINKIVKFFAQRPQVQERLTQQILLALQTLLGTDDVAVTIEATHYCVKARGVMDANSTTQTTAMGGQFKLDDRMRAEFIS
ncbi:MAG: GTP cyclohydrolase I FolE [Gammaproteobacteria bacterium]|jgi:GTP cyclohydrolase I|nr:GTP cyclohydrolase I FolE [Gammaproteobacteria bacterium]MBT5203431.1 GTP cyclohydrolase I FolE [Gammaproteobacteria bacterium]MBT5602665.1 GTP cyclohydrolase I FolE [Gammaproteobacteria bacterium]MBT6245654.1 GTP cyclohydrolase I FolE [Gammaproteobacteria bacterium]